MQNSAANNFYNSGNSMNPVPQSKRDYARNIKAVSPFLLLTPVCCITNSRAQSSYNNYGLYSHKYISAVFPELSRTSRKRRSKRLKYEPLKLMPISRRERNRHCNAF